MVPAEASVTLTESRLSKLWPWYCPELSTVSTSPEGGRAVGVGLGGDARVKTVGGGTRDAVHGGGVPDYPAAVAPQPRRRPVRGVGHPSTGLCFRKNQTFTGTRSASWSRHGQDTKPQKLLNNGGRLAVGSWRLVAVGGWRLVILGRCP